MYADSIQLRLLSGETDINYGAVYENFVSQELRAHGFERLYYFKSRKQGEVDFLISRGNADVHPAGSHSFRYDLHPRYQHIERATMRLESPNVRK